MKKNIKRMIAYYKPYKGTFFADIFFALVCSGIALVIPLVVRYITSNIAQIILIVLILALLLIVVLTTFKKNKEEETVEETELSVDDLLTTTQEHQSVEDIDLESKSEIRLMVEKFVDENPDASAQLLRNWLNEEWG